MNYEKICKNAFKSKYENRRLQAGQEGKDRRYQGDEDVTVTA